MEHYLAFARVTLSDKTSLISKALKSKDPVQAKYILNSLKEDHVQEWDAKVATVALEGLRAKFHQNRHLKDKLLQTYPLTFGEASLNPRWGIGLDLNNPEVLNKEKWVPSGNLLGHSLMEIRQELREKHSGK